MRHGKRFNHLSRTSAHRKAMLANMASSLIVNKRIKTTVAKAKALRTYIEPLITKSKDDTTHSRRVVFSYLKDKEAVTELFREVSVKVADRPGGYTRIIKIGPRLGDNAEMALIELVDYNENLLEAKDKGQKKTRRRRGGGAKKEAEAASPGQAVDTSKNAEETAEAVKEETAAEVSEPEAAKEPDAEAAETVEADEVKEEKMEEAEVEAKEEEKEEEKEEPETKAEEETKEENKEEPEADAKEDDEKEKKD